MRGLVWVGVLLVVLGIAGLAVRGFTYTTEEKVVDLGPIHATADKEHNVYIYAHMCSMHIFRFFF